MQYFRFKYLPLSSFSSTVCPLDTLQFGTILPASSDQSTTDKAGAKEHQLLGENPGCVKLFKLLQTYFFYSKQLWAPASQGTNWEAWNRIWGTTFKKERTIVSYILGRLWGWAYSWVAQITAGAPGPRSNSLYQYQCHLNHPQATRKARTVICHAKHTGKSFAIGQEFTNNMYFLKKNVRVSEKFGEWNIFKKTFWLLQTWNDFKQNCWGSAWPTDALPGALVYWEGTELCLSNQEQVWQNWYWSAAGDFRKLWLLFLSPPPPLLPAAWSYSYQPWGLCVLTGKCSWDTLCPLVTLCD